MRIRQGLHLAGYVFKMCAEMKGEAQAHYCRTILAILIKV